MDIRELFVAANEALKRTVSKVRANQWEELMPAEFPSYAKVPQTLREVIGYHAFDDAWMPDLVSGRTMKEAGTDKFNGDLLGNDPKGSYNKYNQQASAAVAGLTSLSTTLHFSYGDYPASEGLLHVTIFRGFRAYDIAKVIGADTKLPDDLVVGLWQHLLPVVEEYRQMGIFGSKIEVADNAPLQARLLGLVGRDMRV